MNVSCELSGDPSHPLVIRRVSSHTREERPFRALSPARPDNLGNQYSIGRLSASTLAQAADAAATAAAAAAAAIAATASAL